MGLKEEMTADIDALAVTKPVGKATKKANDPTVHTHGDGRCEEQWTDDEGRRRTRPAQGRIPSYVFNCKACMAEDAKRMAAPPVITEDDLEHVVFLIPERVYDSRVVRAYLSKRYPGMELLAMSDIRPARLAMHKGARIVVVNRRYLPGNSVLGPQIIQAEDRHGGVVETPVDPAQYIGEVVESAPLDVSECVMSSQGSMFSDATVDLKELCLRLCDLAAPTNYIAQYKRIVGSDEQMFTMRTLG